MSPFSVSQQKAYISADLNSTLLFQFLFGIYTGVFPATIYVYLHKENRSVTKDRIVIGSIAVLYGVTALIMIPLNWFYTDDMICTNGGTRADMFNESTTVELPAGLTLMRDLKTFIGFFLADGLLVWRCSHAHGRSFKRTLLPIGLLIVEIAIVTCTTVYQCLFTVVPDFVTVEQAKVLDRLNAAKFVSVAATSLIATLMICRQIYICTAPGSSSRRRYRIIINALIQSSALYSASVIFTAILDFLDTGALESSFTVAVTSQYASALVEMFTGLAPTLMVGQLALSSGYASYEETKLSSARLPSELLVHGDTQPDIEMQQFPSQREENEEIMMVNRQSDILHKGDRKAAFDITKTYVGACF
ncbi:hypothetical protein D9613_012680 [Agrocybe pediades]|uniref:Uncharacterized protein n=1 Tax=Agrocybe pediades TaxID=84607 RepID=A0A8H4QV80_9AGAR|nr:hypothetical protein D9613_012680 [Agrocybe pediades]